VGAQEPIAGRQGGFQASQEARAVEGSQRAGRRWDLAVDRGGKFRLPGHI
jgi:hypothetical protein